jgi:hypothetical protein
VLSAVARALSEKLEGDTPLNTVISGGAPMAGTPDITLVELSELYHDLKRQHLVPLWEIAPRILPRESQPQAISTSGAGPILPRWPSAPRSWSPSSAAANAGGSLS